MYALSRGVSLRTAWFFRHWFWNNQTDSLKDFKIMQGILYLRNSETRIPIQSLPLFNPRLDWLHWCMKHLSFRQTNNQLLASYYMEKKPFRFLVRNFTDILVIKEALWNLDYLWRTTKPAVMVDFGVNHAIVSLHCAASQCFWHIYGYELVPDTFQSALNNIALNPEIKDQITLENKGVGKTERIVDVGGFSSGDVRANIYGDNKVAGKEVLVKIIRASDVIEKVRKRHPGCGIYLKMDIEGAEEEVLEDLVETGQLMNIETIIMEYHKGLHNKLSALLQDNGFGVRCQGASYIGLLHAWRLHI